MRSFSRVLSSVYDLRWSDDKKYGEIRLAEEQQFSEYSFNRSDAKAIRAEFELHEKQAKELLDGFRTTAREGAGDVSAASGIRPLLEVLQPF